MTYEKRPVTRHVRHFLDTLAWAGVTLRDDGARLTCVGDATGLLQREVDAREAAIRQWWAEQAREAQEVGG